MINYIHNKYKHIKNFIILIIISITSFSYANIINYPWDSTKLNNDNAFKDEYIGNLDYTGKYSFLFDDLNNINHMKFTYGVFTKKLFKNETYLDDNFINTSINIMKSFHNNMINANKEIYYFIAPTKELVYYDYIKDFNVNINDNNDLSKFINKANDENLNIVFPIETLIKAKEYVHTFYTDDLHWNEVGGYLATIDLYKKMGLEYKPLSDQLIYEYNIDSHIGDCFYKLYYIGDGIITLKDTHGKDEPLAEYINTLSTAKRDKNLSIIGDSFRYYIHNILSKDFKMTNSIILHAVNDNDIIKNIVESDIIIIETTVDNLALMQAIVTTLNNYLFQ